MMDIKGSKSGSAVNVTSMLARVAVTKNHENRELIKEPVQKEVPREPAKAENSSNNSTVAPTDSSNTQSNAQTTGRLVNVNV